MGGRRFRVFGISHQQCKIYCRERFGLEKSYPGYEIRSFVLRGSAYLVEHSGFHQSIGEYEIVQPLSARKACIPNEYLVDMFCYNLGGIFARACSFVFGGKHVSQYDVSK